MDDRRGDCPSFEPSALVKAFLDDSLSLEAELVKQATGWLVRGGWLWWSIATGGLTLIQKNA
jgi:hypothetical protein